MDKVIDYIIQIPDSVILSLIFFVLLLFLVIVNRAFKEGREISFWPPKIGQRPLKKENSQKDSKETVSNPETEESPLSNLNDNLRNIVKLKGMPIALLYIEAGSSAGQCFIITESTTTLTIGTSKESDFCLDEPYLSRSHARIKIKKSSSEHTDKYTFTLIDSGSTSGTRVNQTQTEKQELHRGDIIHLGLLRIIFVTCMA